MLNALPRAIVRRMLCPAGAAGPSLSLVAALLISGCSGGSGGSAPCNTPAVPLVTLVSPPSDSTNVPTGIGELILAETSGAPGSTTISVTSPTGTLVAGVTPQAAPSPLPSPLATPPSGEVTYLAVDIPTLSSGTAYTVEATYSIGSAGPCPTSFPTKVGSFATN